MKDGKEHAVKIVYLNDELVVFMDNKELLKAVIDINTSLGRS